MDGKMLARLAAIAFVAIAITATAIEMNRKEEPAEPWASAPPASPRSDPLRDELARCRSLGEAGSRDPSCRRAWAENRRRFLAPSSRPAEHLPEAPAAPHSAEAQ